MRSRRPPVADEKDRWLISYSDFITLLFAFFVVMYASSSQHEQKYKILSESLRDVFDAVPRSFEPIQLGEPSAAATTEVVDVPDSSAMGHPTEGDTLINTVAQVLQEKYAGFSADDSLQIESNNDWLEISLSANLAFAQGSARLTEQALAVLATTTEYISGFSAPITVEGYTDNVPSNLISYPSNWALSSARAASVAAYFEQNGVDRKRLSAVGYGDNHGLLSNATPSGRAQNRRVVIVVARRGNLARDLNASPASSAFAFVRHEAPQTLGAGVRQQRTADGGLRFTN